MAIIKTGIAALVNSFYLLAPSVAMNEWFGYHQNRTDCIHSLSLSLANKHWWEYDMAIIKTVIAVLINLTISIYLQFFRQWKQCFPIIKTPHSFCKNKHWCEYDLAFIKTGIAGLVNYFYLLAISVAMKEWFDYHQNRTDCIHSLSLSIESMIWLLSKQLLQALLTLSIHFHFL